MRLQKILIINRAPFNFFEINFDDANVNVLSGINGTGKTTIISYIVDSWYELARDVFSNEFAGKENKFYRLSSGLYTLDSHKPSIVYLRYLIDSGKTADYIDIRGTFTEIQYEETLGKFLEKYISYSDIQKEIKEQKLSKHWNISDKQTIKSIFDESLMTYFPAYRYETPAYLNDPYKIKLKFNTDDNFAGYLINPLEVATDLPEMANWIMDIILDGQIYENSTLKIRNNFNKLLTDVLYSKVKTTVRLGIGQRNSGISRIAIMDASVEGRQIYPSIFSMSSGELALVCLFGELLKQVDKVHLEPSTVTGIVLVDEIDKHLHIRLQKDVLPKLLDYFPNVQFIVSSHSPFMQLGLDNETLSYHIYDMDNKGIECCPQDNDLFQEVYDMMIQQNDQFKKLYDNLSHVIDERTKTLIITEGKTDWKHLKAAQQALKIDDLDVDYYETEEPLGDKNLLSLLKDYARISQTRKIIGIFDRDNFDKLEEKSLETDRYVSLGNNVFMFAIPKVNEDIYGSQISIEHYYSKTDLFMKDSEGRRLFLGSEFNEKGRSLDNAYITRFKGIDHKSKINGIIDEKVYDLNDLDEKHSLAMSKKQFCRDYG